MKTELPVELNPKFSKLKSKKDLVQGMVLRIPWPKSALDTDLNYLLCPALAITANGAVIETPNGGKLEITNFKDMYYVKGTEKKNDDSGNQTLLDSVR